MSVDLWWLGADYGDDYATVVVRCTTDETVTVGCDGRNFTANALSATSNGVVKITITGLTPGHKYPYTINGGEGGMLRTKRQTGPWYIASGSCWSKVRRDDLAERLLAGYDLDLFIAFGDLPYTDWASTEWGETTLSTHGSSSTLAANIDPANYMAHHRQARKIPGLKELIRNVPFLYMPDDHEYCYDNGCPPDGDGGPSHLLWQASVVGASLYADFVTAWDASLAAIDAYTIGNPVNTDAGIDADAKYSRMNIGPLEIITIDCCRYRTAYNAADNASKTMLGPNQEVWAKDAVPASTSIWKLIGSGKQFFKGGGNTDTWTVFTTERNEMFYAWRNVTGMLCLAGDQHLWSDQFIAADELGAGYPAFSCLVGCPTSVELNPTGATGYPVGVVSKVNGYSGVTNVIRDNVVAVLKITEARIDRFLLSTQRGVMPMGYIEAGSNQVQYPQTRFG